MPRSGDTFFSFVAAHLVALGTGGKGYEVYNRGNNGIAIMIIACMREYNVLPPLHALSVPEIKYFYGYLKAEILGAGGGGG